MDSVLGSIMASGEQDSYIIVEDMKFKKKNEAGDGNCLFRSIGTGEFHDQADNVRK
jgi:hypothetical protein